MQESLSLPRIKPAADNAGSEDPLLKNRGFKFKKLKLNESQQQLSSGIPPLRNNRTERSVAVGLSKEEQKSLKTQRTNLNLAEKRMREGNYSEHAEVGSDLATLKHECSEKTTRFYMLQSEIEKLQRMIEDVKGQLALNSNDAGALTIEMQRRQQRCYKIKTKVEDIRYERSRLLNMIRDRKSDNIKFMKRVEDEREELAKLQKRTTIILTSELEIRDRQNDAESKYRAALAEYEVSTRQNQRVIDEQQQKFQRIVENETNREDRKRKLVNISMSVVEEQKERNFRNSHNVFLTNRVLNRFLEDKMNRLTETNERIFYLFRQAADSYGPFTPEEFVVKYFNQQPQREKITIEVKQLESNITTLEEKKRKLKKQSAELQIEYLALGEQLENRLQKLSEDEAVDPELNDQTAEAESKLKVINEWSVKYLQLLEAQMVSKKDRTQNLQNLPQYERLSKIMEVMKQWSNRTN